ncbi:hypothetical protein CDAR_517961 [Caerostris darwini]|uniref:Ribosomal protein S19 n=1 Tax=Caerostris darwini TaxID=1538125 RepID=A0AAV4QUX5_9ARAC|nr:hypothetical protein CDAR_517961 [Caerostris darwini]
MIKSPSEYLTTENISPVVMVTSPKPRRRDGGGRFQSRKAIASLDMLSKARSSKQFWGIVEKPLLNYLGEVITKPDMRNFQRVENGIVGKNDQISLGIPHHGKYIPRCHGNAPKTQTSG